MAPASNLICPMCSKDVLEGTRAFPFCSERCRLLDLGNWLDERYVVPAQADDEIVTGEEEPGTLPSRRLH